MDRVNESENKRQEYENLAIRMKIIDMIEYSIPLIEKWSIAHQKLLGDKIAYTMEEMLMLANEVQFSPSKKTALKKLDLMNKGLQDLITTAYRMKYLKGSSTMDEWTRRSKEIGSMVGGYAKYLHADSVADQDENHQFNSGVISGRRSRRK